MLVNNSVVNTSNNFRINNFEIDENFNRKNNNFNNYKFSNINLKELKETSLVKYGISKEAIDEINSSSNFKYEINIDNDKYSFLEFNLDKDNKDLVENIKLDIKKNSELNLVINYKSDKEGKFYHNGLIKTILNENSKAKIIIINNLNIDTNNLLTLDSECKSNSQLDYILVDIGSHNSVINYYTSLKGNDSINNVSSIYVGTKNQKYDFNYLIDCYGERTKANIDTQGALNNEAKKNFKGTIDFKKGCKKSVGNENEYCILLSDKCVSKSLPMLLCSEDDVIGTHASASGKVNDKSLFYIMSRGVNKKEAEKLIVKSKFNRALNMIKDDETKKYIDELIDSKL